MSDIRQVEPGVWSALEGTRVYEIRVTARAVYVNGRELPAEATDSRDRNPQSAPPATTGAVQIKATMPGKVVRVLVVPGDQVAAGQAVAIVEAMKMQNEVRAPRAGRVSAVSASENGTVIAGAVLVTLE